MSSKQSGLRGQLTDIDFRLLRIFKSVVECGGYSAAEVVLNINRSTISVHMSDLETRLGMVLCNRGRGRSSFSLTEQGEEVYRVICDLFVYLDQFRNRINAIQSELTGHLRLTLPDDLLEIPDLRLPEVIASFRQAAPNVTLEVLAHAPGEVDLDILNGNADLGINVLSLKRPGLEYLPLYRHRTSLYCGDTHALFSAPDAELSLDLVTTNDLVGDSYSFSPEIAERYNLFQSRTLANHMAGRALMILSGSCVGFLPDYYAKRWLEQGRLRKLDLPDLSYQLDNAVLYRRSDSRRVLIQMFVEELKQALAPGLNRDSDAWQSLLP
ncbi:LysR family transcriptional regulator [Pseudomaricurvus alkylphenolicus]|jgi:DNA-binding transcriptional LysR family regulator|uniref:LysR family transcriptional regulator n=1 Tax=Pseudomaricurvus alkylphenolicus TaxID=1306991 RepID=UPI00141DA548|nr:LysR family transcriptional regulator [Pseudomaricurvus alkylphenolicus]NIB42618.1 LysR family transcriptional regulator [Pseudomaricurvus alkylphenolicus]